MAGVDCDYTDEAQDWLAEAEDRAAPTVPKVEAKPERAEPERQPAIAPGAIPQDIEAFRAWWLDAASPLPAGSGPRIAPRGDTGAEIMLVAPMPEAGDTASLLAGPQGIMFANICRALGVNPAAAYIASALPCHMPLPDWDDLRFDGLGAVLARHVELAKPARVILFGGKLPALLGHDPAAPPDSFREIAGVPALATFAPDRLLDHPRQRARLWHRLLEWTA